MNISGITASLIQSRQTEYQSVFSAYAAYLNVRSVSWRLKARYPQRRQRLLARTPVSAVWGIGRRLGRRLNDMEIETALDLAQTDYRLIRKRFSVVQERVVRELNGESCLPLETRLQATRCRDCGKITVHTSPHQGDRD